MCNEIWVVAFNLLETGRGRAAVARTRRVPTSDRDSALPRVCARASASAPDCGAGSRYIVGVWSKDTLDGGVGESELSHIWIVLYALIPSYPQCIWGESESECMHSRQTTKHYKFFNFSAKKHNPLSGNHESVCCVPADFSSSVQCVED